MSKKPRPLDGPGANGLRGGRNVYPSGKTAIGVWLDEKGGPSGYKRGFTNSDYLTEGQVAQLGATLKKAPEFGAELCAPEHITRKPPCAGDLFNPVYSGTGNRDWMSNTQSAYLEGTRKIKETHLPRSNMDRETLKAYQQTWSSDTVASRTMRFQTENIRAGNAANKLFQTKTLRLLPGTPAPLEKFRSLLIEMHGVLAFACLKSKMGMGIISCAQFKTRLASTGVKLSLAEVNQILAYFSPTDDLNVDQMVRMVVARTDGFEAHASHAATKFAHLFGTSSDRVSFQQVIECLNFASPHSEVCEGLQEYIAAYAADSDSLFGVNEFVAIHSDMYACSGGKYSALFEGDEEGAGLWAVAR